MSNITTHVLDTSKGMQAAGLKIILFRNEDKEWITVAGGSTNTDGRITDLLEKNSIPDTGIYKLKFETKEYSNKEGVETFYPFTEIIFEVKNKEHYHVPLLLNA